MAFRKEIVSEDAAREMKSVDHDLRHAITHFVWSPDDSKKQHIIRLLDEYQDHWQLKGN